MVNINKVMLIDSSKVDATETKARIFTTRSNIDFYECLIYATASGWKKHIKINVLGFRPNPDF